MAISVVQSIATPYAGGSFSDPVTEHNSVILVAQAFGTGAGTSAPTYNGGSVAGAVLLTSIYQPLASNQTYCGIWLLPNLSGGSVSFALTYTGSCNGMTALEIAGLGASPQLDANGGSSTDSGTSSNAFTSGNVPALASPNAILIGTVGAYAVVSGNYTQPSGWTLLPPASYSCAGYQIVSGATGEVFAYDPTATNSNNWTGAVVALVPTSSSGSAAPSGLLIASII